MDYLAILLLVFFSWAFIHSIISNQRSRSGSDKRRRHPPGPRPFPLIGNILELGSNPHQSLARLSKIFGPMMTLKLGSRTTIVISSPDMAEEVLKKKDQAFSSRMVPDVGRVLDHKEVSMVWLPASSAKWRSLRRACATKIFSSLQLDTTQILRERKAKELLDYVGESCKKGEALDIGEAAFTTVLNSLSNTLFSVDLVSYNSNSSQEFKDIVGSMMEESGRPNVVDFFPILRPFDPQRAYAKCTTYFRKFLKYFDGIIEKRICLRASKVESTNYNDVLDSFLNTTEKQLNHLDVLHLFADLFIAGTDTTSNTVEWAMAELMSNPEKLGKARKELQQVLGKDGKLEESDISKFPYLQAVVKETLRLHPPVPFLLPRKSIEDVEIESFTVPKDAQILINVWAMGRDSSIWAGPDLFEPERFLESEIGFKGNDFRLIPFGAGRRMCPGLPLANRTAHFILASLLYSYDWKLADGLKPNDIDMREKFGITLKKAQPLQVIPIKA